MCQPSSRSVLSTILPVCAADGRVVIAGGETAEGVLNSIEVFDPATLRFTVTGAMTSSRKNHAAVLLEDGRVLIAGGANEVGSLASLELFDPSSGAVTPQGELLVARAGLSATRLADGTVLLAGGMNGPETLASAEIFDPVKGTTAETAAMMHARSGHMAFLLPGSGEVLLAGGDGGAGTAELFSQASVRSIERQRSAAEAQLSAAAAGGVMVKAAAGTGAATLDQCANGPAPALGEIGKECVWVNGNLNSSKASYREGDAVAYRLRMSGVPTTGSNTVTIEWDTTQSGKHALDYLTNYNLAVSKADPCIGGACTFANSKTFPIPLDSNIRDDLGQPLGMVLAKAQMPGQQFTIWGGDITGVSGYTKSGEYSGSSSTSITITFTASVANPVIAWGGHIATRVDWGAAYSAVAINGSPFHTRLVALNGGGGNQDRALSNDAADFPASILVTKVTNVPTADNVFTFTSSPGLPDGDPTAPVSEFKLPVTINGQQLYSRLFDKIFVPSGTPLAFTLSETSLPAGWTLQSIRCVKLNTTDPVGTNGSSVTLNLTEGDSYSCTFTNAGPVQVSVTKACVPTDDTGQFTMAISGTSPASQTLACGGTMSRSVAIGSTVSLTETGDTLANYSTSINCGTGRTSNTSSISFTMPNAAVSCTVTNTRNSYNVTVNKVCMPANDPGRFVLQVNGSGSEVGCSSPGNSVVRSVVGGQPVEVKELAGTGTLLSDYVSDIACTGITLGGTGLTRTFTMPDSAVTCTVTNKKPGISITKTCKTGLNASLAVKVTSTGQVCNTGGVDLTGLSLTDVQIIGEGTGVTGSVTFDTATLAPGACRNYSSTFTPTAASSGSCAPDDATCTIAFTDKVTVTASGGGVAVSDNKTATCTLCK